MLAALIVIGLMATIIGLVVTILVVRRFLRAVEGIEEAVWAVADEVHGGVGVRLPGTRTQARPTARRRTRAI